MDKELYLSTPLPVRRSRKQEWVSALAHAASIISNYEARVNSQLAWTDHQAKATDKVGTGSNDLRQPAEGLYLGSEDWVIERLVWVGNV